MVTTYQTQKALENSKLYNMTNKNDNFIHIEKRMVVKSFIAEKSKAIGKKDRRGRITYIPQECLLYKKPAKVDFSF